MVVFNDAQLLMKIIIDNKSNIQYNTEITFYINYTDDPDKKYILICDKNNGGVRLSYEQFGSLVYELTNLNNKSNPIVFEDFYVFSSRIAIVLTEPKLEPERRFIHIATDNSDELLDVIEAFYELSRRLTYEII